MSTLPARGWLIDPTVISELRKGCRAAAPVRTWARTVAPAVCFLSEITVEEIRLAIEEVRRPALRAELEAWMRDGLMPWFGDRVLALDERVLRRWGQLVSERQQAGYTYDGLDDLLAATAIVHGLGVVTRNVARYERAGLRPFNPWNEA